MSRPLLRRLFAVVSLGVSLRARVVLGTMLPVVGIIAYFGYSSLTQRKLTLMAAEVLEKRIVAMSSADQIKQSVLGYDDALFRYMTLRDPTHLTEGLRLKARIRSLIESMHHATKNPILVERLGLLTEEAALFFQDAEKLLEYAQTHPTPIQEIHRQSLSWVRKPDPTHLHFAFLSEEGRMRMVRVNALCDEILTINRLELDRARQEMRSLLAQSRRTALLLSVMAILVVLLSGIGFAMALLYPLRDLQGGIRQMAQGELDVQIPVTTEDEIGEIADAFNRAARTIREQREQLVYETITDGLTGVFNQRHFRKLIRQEIERARRSDAPVTLLMMDIDHFKRYNDTFGHEFGNEVLKRVVRIVKDQLREIDMLARYGGDELAVLLPNTHPEQAQHLAGRILSAIAQSSLMRPDSSSAPRLTVSMGGAGFPTDALTAEDLISRADEALYAAKQGGRARLHWAGESAAIHKISA